MKATTIKYKIGERFVPENGRYSNQEINSYIPKCPSIFISDYHPVPSIIITFIGQ